MDVDDDICKHIKHKVKCHTFLAGIPAITIEDKRQMSTSESSSSEYETSDISQTSTHFSTDKAKPDEGAINITKELIDSLITDSPSDVKDEQGTFFICHSRYFLHICILSAVTIPGLGRKLWLPWVPRVSGLHPSRPGTVTALVVCSNSSYDKSHITQ